MVVLLRKVCLFLRISTYSLVSDLCLRLREVFETKPIKASVEKVLLRVCEVVLFVRALRKFLDYDY